MPHWTLVSFLAALLLAIFVPALIIHLTIGRKGGHSFFKSVPKEEMKSLPFKMLNSRIRNQLVGSSATLIGLAIALTLYPLACIIGMPLHKFGLSDNQFVFAVTLGIVLLVRIGFAIYRNRCDK
jgi:hypothetical protein